MKATLIAIALVLITGCSVLPGRDYSVPLLFNPTVFNDRLEASVMSNGCTSAADFYLVVSEGDVTLRQINPDLCRAAPSLIRLSFNYGFSDKVYKLKNKVRYMNRVQVR
ncbi:hypothetical protein [Reinekea sp.]|jgi:hypothetical protein|uniref:hypothetical protein n=1 Tax=Reinekea sp. TaxID=1970455 RepID=UPI00398937A8